MQCPLCNLPMVAAERQGVEVDVCLRCHGLWFDSGEIELLAETLGLSEPALKLRPAGVSQERTLRCPRCDTAMAKALFPHSEVPVVDACRSGHGVWLDRGELGALFAQGGSGGSPTEVAVVEFLGELLER